MATVKIKFVKHTTTLVAYLMDDRSPDDPVEAKDCEARFAAQDFQAIGQFHKGHGEINGIHIVQSWNKEESQKLSPVEFNAIGRKLAEEQFPGHAFLVVTHTDTGNFHNHILVNPWHTETGRKVENKKHHLFQLRAKSDDLCKAHGLSVIDGSAKDRQARLPDKVQKIARYNGKSWLLDMYQKADFARAYATSHDEYMALMKELGVTVRVEDRNVAYFYGGQQRAKRGSKMGVRYDKEGLEKAYKANAEKFAQVPGLRENVSPAPTDYAAFQRKARPGRSQRFAHEADLGKSVVPIEDMRRARSASILQYCQRNCIALVRHDDGRVTMKGRDFVEIGEFEWVNTRNRTRGSLIELVAAHKQTTLLQAIAEINGNQRLLALEQHFGQVPRKFTSFYIPKESRLREQDAKSKLASLLASHGADGGHARTLLKTEQVQVDQAGSIRLFPRDDHGGTHEFVERSDKTWARQKSGSFKEAFFTLLSGRTKAVVYLDPFSFLQHGGKRAFMPRERGEDVICLMEPDHGILDTLLAKHRHLSELHIFTGSQGDAGRAEVDFFNNLKANLANRRIEVKEAKGQARSKSRSHDLPSM